MTFGLMAFGVTGAHAETGATWLILNSGGELKTGAKLSASINLRKDTEEALHSEIFEIKVLFLCTAIEALNAKLLEEGIVGNTVITNIKGLKEGRGSQIKFSGCTTDLDGEPAPECVPTDPFGGNGTIITKPGHGLLKLHTLITIDEIAKIKIELVSKDDVVKILPDEGETLATIRLPATCPIGTSVPVIGSLALQDCQALALTHLVEHLVEPFGPSTELWTISKTPEHKATLLGSAWASLTGEHKNLKFSGDFA